MNIFLDRTHGEPLYLQIRNQIRQLILCGSLPPGYRLPSERGLAGLLGVNRSTVTGAYQELEADGLVESRVGRGTTVKPQAGGKEGGDPAGRPLVWKHLFSRQCNRVTSPLISDIFEWLNADGVISFAAGVPSADRQPAREFACLYGELLSRRRNILEHSPTAGYWPLREYIADHMAQRGVRTGPENVVIVAGSQQGLDLIARVLLEPGDVVVVEEPSYLGAIGVFRAAGVRLLGVPVDEEGMRVDLLERLLERYRPKLIYTLPTFQNPSGVTMSRERRLALMQTAYRHQVPVLEDDAYSELYYDGIRPPLLKSLDPGDQVIYLSTFSKILFPGLRVGWVVAPAEVTRQLVLAKQLVDLHTNTPAQVALAEFCRRKLLAGHLTGVRKEYAQRRDAMLGALIESAPPGLAWNRPQGGYYVWCSLPPVVTATRLLAATSERKVVFLPGDAFFAGSGGSGFIRLSFSACDEETIRKGVAVIGEVLGELCRRSANEEKEKRGGADLMPLT
ncbi:MAG TPA: PLP-dependent aminotransferase family protein [Spirochaetia bacterium]|nr:PLP-dependent aminotransferase family protein [Spirochaetia bacterium]